MTISSAHPEALTAEDDCVVHRPGAGAWSETWSFAFADVASGVHGVARAERSPAGSRSACTFGVWRGDRAVVLDRVAGVTSAADEPLRVGPLTLRCTDPHERWTVEYDGEHGSGSFEWMALAAVYDWGATELLGGQRYEQAGRVSGSLETSGQTVAIAGFGRRERSWGAPAGATMQQRWSASATFGEAEHYHHSLVTIEGRDYVFGNHVSAGRMQPLAGLDLYSSFGYRWGPPVRTQVQAVDAAGREMGYVAAPRMVLSSVVADEEGTVDSHLTFSTFTTLDGDSTTGCLEHWFTSPDVVRSHLAVNGTSRGYIYDRGGS